jgi:hypothetical protein
VTRRTCAVPECNAPLFRREGETEKAYARRICCCQRCGSKLGQWRAKEARNSGVTRAGLPVKTVYVTPEFVPWPRVTGGWPARWEETRPFARHNVVANDGGTFRFARPDNQSYSMSTAAWLMRDAVS